MCLRFDHHQAWQRKPAGNFRSTKFARPYFTACATAYILGLVTTVVVMHTFKAAQPALLYLSPACILSTLLTAAVRGEIKELFAYSTEEDNEEAKKGKKDSQSGKKVESVTEEKTGAVEKQASANSQVADDADKAEDADVEDDDYVAVNADDSKSASPKASKKKKGSKKKGGK